MLADVTNRARGARGFWLAGGATHFVEPGATARLDLADHALHGAWAAAGEVEIAPVEGAAEDVQAQPEEPGRSGGRRGRPSRIAAGST